MVSIYKRNRLREVAAFLSVMLRWPMFLFLPICRIFKINCLFTVYPGSVKDWEGYALARKKRLVKYISGKPFVAGVITSEHGYGRGLVLALPNTIDQLKNDRKLVGKIMRRLNFARKATGAKTIGIAGQGPRCFRSHYPYEEPFIYGLRGRVFSVMETLERIYERHNLSKADTSIALLGIGEIGEAIIQNLRDQGYNAEGININSVDGQVVISGDGLETLKEPTCLWSRPPEATMPFGIIRT